ncbi:elongation factor 2 [Trichonephila clavipes]|nr:elongation factor 2 [Trichonephila clavipes]
MLTNALSVLGACQWLDARRGGNRRKENESKNKTITPNCVPVKKDGLHVKDDQRTVTVSPVVKVSVEFQHPSDLPKLEDDLKRLGKSDPMIQCVTEKPDDYIVSDTEEFLFENCLKDVKEDKACIPLKKTDPVVVVPESVPKEVKRCSHEKRRPRLKENKDYYFIPKRRPKIENSVAYCDHRVLVNHKRRNKEDVPLKTYHIDHLGPHRITEIEEGVMEQTLRFEQDLQ